MNSDCSASLKTNKITNYRIVYLTPVLHVVSQFSLHFEYDESVCGVHQINKPVRFEMLLLKTN